MNLKLILFALGLAIISSNGYAMEKNKQQKKEPVFKSLCSNFKVKNNNVKLTCCNKNFTTKHITTHINGRGHRDRFNNNTHNANFTIHQCVKCSKYFPSIQSLKKHTACRPINKMAIASLLNDAEPKAFEKFEFLQVTNTNSSDIDITV